jgi:hypothetical protein
MTSPRPQPGHAGCACGAPGGGPAADETTQGHTSDAHDFGDVGTAHIAPRHTTYGTTYLLPTAPYIVERTSSSWVHTGNHWITRVPATLTEAQHTLVQATPATIISLSEGYRYYYSVRIVVSIV